MGKWWSDIYIYFNFTSLVHGNSEIISISVFSSLWWMPWWFQSHSWENSQPFWAQPSSLTVDTRNQIKKSRMKKINVPKYASSSSEVNIMIHLWTFSKVINKSVTNSQIAIFQEYSYDESTLNYHYCFILKVGKPLSICSVTESCFLKEEDRKKLQHWYK